MTTHRLGKEPLDGVVTEVLPPGGAVTEALPPGGAVTEALPQRGALTEALPPGGAVTEALPPGGALTAASVLRGKRVALPDTSVLELWEQTARERHHKVAVTDSHGGHTFRQVDDRAERLADAIRTAHSSHDGNPDAIRNATIAVLLAPSSERIVALVAVCKLHAVYLPLDVTLPLHRLRHMLAETHTRVLVTEAEGATDQAALTALTAELRVSLVHPPRLVGDTANTLPPKVQPSPPGETNCDEDPVFCILYTSGSSGEPKGIPLRMRNVLNRLFWFWSEFPIQDEEVSCHKTSPLFVDSITEILSSLLVGIPIFVFRKEQVLDPETFLALLEEHRITRLVLVPSFLQSLLTICDYDPSYRACLWSLKLLISSGETLSPALASKARSALPDTCLLANLYGSTEVTGDVTYEIFKGSSDLQEKVKDGQLSIGRPIYNTDVYILDSELHPIAEGTVGEVFVSGINIAQGYIGLAPGAFLRNVYDHQLRFALLYRTGDLGRKDGNSLYYMGRSDSIIKVRGHRVSLLEVEKVICSVDGVTKVVVLGVELPNGTQEIVACYTTNDRDDRQTSVATRTHTDAASSGCDEARACRDQDPLASVGDAILARCRARLPAYMVPRVHHMESLPLQPQTGKVDRTRIQSSFRQTAMSSRSEPDKDISQLFASQLNITRQTLMHEKNKTFYELGGNSLSAVATVMGLRSRGVRVPFEALSRLNISDFIQMHDRDSMNLKPPDGLATSYHVVPLTHYQDHDGVMTLVGRGFVEKNPLDIMAGTSLGDFRRLLLSLWTALLDDNLSFVVVDKVSRELVAAMLILDMRTEVTPDFVKAEVAEVNEEVESPVRSRLLREGGRWMDAILNAVDVTLPSGLTLPLLTMMETEVLRLAREEGYDGIITVNSHPVTMDVAEHVFNYDVENTVHVASFVYRGQRPFSHAHPDYVIKCMTKRLQAE